MGITIDAKKYGRLCEMALPMVITSQKDFRRMAELAEELTFKPNSTPEEKRLAELLVKLVEDYDHLHHPAPDLPPHELLAYLMEQRGLKQADLIELIGSSAQVSALVTGKRSISKAQAKKLAAFFKVSAELFI
jgi:HTH-type transcriptional regulator/antitoxin HigA